MRYTVWLNDEIVRQFDTNEEEPIFISTDGNSILISKSPDIEELRQELMECVGQKPAFDLMRILSYCADHVPANVCFFVKNLLECTVTDAGCICEELESWNFSDAYTQWSEELHRQEIENQCE